MATVAIIGAGPSGLASAKAAMEYGLVPTIFESHRLGGLWRRGDGHTWNSLRTNLSKWTCCFSDFPWPDEADEFPTGAAVEDYLASYAAEFQLVERLKTHCLVTRVAALEKGWRVAWTENQIEKTGDLDFVIMAAGVFGTPFVPDIAARHRFPAVIHSSTYKDPSNYRGKRVAVLGSSFSGVEIASDLAAAGVATTLVFRRPFWIVPRMVPYQGGVLPLDLAFYRRQPPGGVSPNNRQRAAYFESTFGNPGDDHPDLRVTVDDGPPFVVVSDAFRTLVSQGAIGVCRGTVATYTSSGIHMADGTDIAADVIIECTGYTCELGVLDNAVLNAISYRREDRFVPFLADKAVYHPAFPTLAFVGTYRGPYFGVIELQARWACSIFAADHPPLSAESLANIEEERHIREMDPQPQFPHANYIEFADSLAAAVGCTPPFAPYESEPVVPAHYRLNGPFAAYQTATAEIARVTARCSR